MESKKINQLATELTPALSDLTIIGDPSTGISKKITLSQMASLFTGTVEEYANLAAFPLVGVADTIYIALDTNVLYRWNTGTNAYVELSPNIINSLVFSDANGFDGNISLVGSVATLTITTALTTGSVPFIGASGALLQDNANLFWDDTNNRLGIGTNAPTTAIDVFGSGIIGRLNGTSTNNAYLGFASGGTNQWSIGNVQSDQRFRIYSEANTAELVSVLQTGEFGIGIANPTTKLHIDGGASALIANLDANVSVAKSISFRSDNSNRINIEVSGTESGSNAGADLFIRTYTDAGALLATPLTITRSTGAITLAGALSGTSASFSSTISAISATLNGLTQDTIQTVVRMSGRNLSNQVKALDFKLTAGTPLWTISTAADGTDVGINIMPNGSSGLSLAYTGIAIFSSRVTTGGTVHITGSGSPTTGAGLEMGYGNLTAGRTTITSYNRTGAAYIGNDYNALDYIWYTSGSQAMTLTSAGNVGIGNSNPLARLSVVASACVVDIESSTSTQYNGLELKNGGGSFYVGQDNSSGNFYGGGAYSGNLYLSGAYPMVFWTGGSERMRITSGGDFLWRKSASVVGDIGFWMQRSNGDLYSTIANSVNTYHVFDATNAVYRFYVGGNGTINATNTTISAISDVRLKENINDLKIGLDAIMALRPRQFDWKKESGNSGKNVRGFIAQEFEQIFPDLIDESINKTSEGEPYKQIRQDLIPILVKAMQQQQTQIEELKALINK